MIFFYFSLAYVSFSGLPLSKQTSTTMESKDHTRITLAVGLFLVLFFLLIMIAGAQMEPELMMHDNNLSIENVDSIEDYNRLMSN